jgi:hypothetical protein
LQSWDFRCRTIINYETHIHPLWSLPRSDPGNAMNPANTDWTCTNCHTNQDAMMMPMVPDGQLDLSDGLSTDEPDHYKSYRELMFPDANLIIDTNGQLVTEQVQVFQFEADGVTPVCQLNANGEPIDAMGNPLDPNDPNLTSLCAQAFDLEDVPAQGPSMSVNGSRSGYFMDIFMSGGIHEGYLTPAEIRLIAEWLDVGGQYYNNPFDAPEN